MAGRSRELTLDRYDTDKITNRYLEYYDPILAPLVQQPITLLELGVHNGGSLALWRDYFPRASIVGIDLKLPVDFVPGERIQLFQGSQADPEFLTSVADRTAPHGFDIIIDDASHMAWLTRPGFWHLFDRHLKPGGLYVVEDWGTGYWSDWPDGDAVKPRGNSIWERLPGIWARLLKGRDAKVPTPSHSYGMVGFIKELVDEQGAADLTRANWTGKAQRESKFSSLTVTPSIVFVRKRSADA
jgi:SAM-dependent methyltransferase